MQHVWNLVCRPVVLLHFKVWKDQATKKCNVKCRKYRLKMCISFYFEVFNVDLQLNVFVKDKPPWLERTALYML